MLFSLMTVLVLLVVAFYALWVGVTGRVNGNEGPELTLPGRVIVLGIALVALAATYLVYQRSRRDAPVVTAAPQAVPSNPPDMRSSAATPSTDAQSVADASAPLAEALPPREPQPMPTASAETPQPLAASETLSAAAAELEAAQAAPRRQLNAIARPVEAPAPLRADATPARAAPRATAPKSRARPRSTQSSLVLHVHNTLGSDQEREQLTLSIEGKAVADIEVDSRQPRVAVAVPLPRPGLLHYRLEGVSERDGRTRLVGEGCIRVRDGARFVVRRKAGSQKVFLETTRVAG